MTKRILAAGAGTPTSAAPASAPPTKPSVVAKVGLATAANSDQVVTGLSFKKAIETIAMERAREAVARGDASPAQTGMVASLGAGFAPATISRIREGGKPETGGLVENNPRVTVWAKENRVRSGDKTVEVVLPERVVLTDKGIKVKLLHISGEKPVTTLQGHQPFAEKANVPSDAFVQAQAAQELSSFLSKLESFKLDLPSVYKDRSNFDGVIRIFINAMDILNAAYVPGKNIYFFGNFKKIFPLAADKDTLIHESSHGLLEHIVPGLVRGSGEGGAWHEAFGDLMACLFHKNPGLGEDLGTFLAKSGQGPEEMTGGIRRLDNNAVLDPQVEEVHDRSLAYSGLMWSTAGKLAKLIGDEDKAADLMLGAVVKANFYLVTTNPTSSDLVQALVHGMRAHFAVHAPEVGEQILKVMVEEAQTRHMLNVPLTKAVKPVAEAASAADVVKLIMASPQIAARKDLSFEVMSDRVFDNVRKATVRPVLSNAAGTVKLPVIDASITAVIENGKIFSMDTATLNDPPRFDLEQGLPELASGVERAKRIIYAHLLAAAEKGSQGAIQMLEAFETLFADANIEAEWVVSRGKLCLSLSSLGGDFIVDVERGRVFPRATLTMEPRSRFVRKEA